LAQRAAETVEETLFRAGWVVDGVHVGMVVEKRELENWNSGRSAVAEGPVFSRSYVGDQLATPGALASDVSFAEGAFFFSTSVCG
jgi:hypothetical protein